MQQNELEHYGVKGMKWGVITKAYTKNRVGDYYTDRQKKKMTKRAVRILENERDSSERFASSYRNSANKHYNKADKHVWKSEDAQRKGDQKTFEKEQGKAWKHLAMQHEELEMAKEFTKMAEVSNKKLKDIASGTVQAGRDFVINTEYSTNLLLTSVGVINLYRQDRIDYEDRND